MKRLQFLRMVGLIVLAAPLAFGYPKPTPRYLEVEFTWRDAAGIEKKSEGQLWFTDIPLKDGKDMSFGKLGYYEGIKWFVPKNPGDIWLGRAAGNTNGQAFLLHDHYGERVIEVSFDRIDVLRTADSRLDKLIESSTRELMGTKSGAGAKPVFKEVDMGDLDPEAKMATSTVDARAKTADGKAVAPLRLATDKDIGVSEIPIGDIVKIVFGKASDNLSRETYTGRYVEYSRGAKGDEGRVQIAAATFFGGPSGQEGFIFGDFLKDDSIMLVGNFLDLDFVDRSVVRVLGTDPARDAYPVVERTVGTRMVTDYPRTTPVVVRYGAGLKALTGVVRLPWGVGKPQTCVLAADESLYIAGSTGPHFDQFIKETKLAATIAVSEAGPESVVDNRGRKRQVGEKGQKDEKAPPRKLGPEFFVLKLAPDLRSVAWVIRVQDGGLNMFMQPDGRLLVRRGLELFHITADGAVFAGATLDLTGGQMAVCPKTGAIYFGGSYRSATGLEPYVNPYLYKMDASGKMVWTAYGWSGPIVGVDQHRLVADSAVTRVKVAGDGRLSLTAWSDGGNTVLAYQPYDMRKPAKCGGFCSSTWGARGGMTVRIATLINMDPDTMEVSAYNSYVGYIPTSDIPTLINIYDSYRLPNGEVAVTGGSWTGFVETHDAWTPSWWRQFQTDEFALAKGGPFFTLFSSDLSRARMATITPGAVGLHMAGKGQWLLLYGMGKSKDPSSFGKKWSPSYPTLVHQAVQSISGGDYDAYVMLVNTQGEPVKEAK